MIRKQFHLETDHKPLVALLGQKGLDELPLRIQRFRMRLLHFDYKTTHVPGKSLFTADALSRKPVSVPSKDDEVLELETTTYETVQLQSLPAGEEMIQKIKEEQDTDATCRQVKIYARSSWPPKAQLKGEVKLYAGLQQEMSVNEGLLLRGTRIVIPSTMRAEILDKLHSGHQGVVKTRERAKGSVWWPRLSTQIEELVLRCPVCTKE